MTIKKQIAGSPTTTLSTSVTVTGSGGTYTASPTTFGLTDMSAVPSTTGTETNYITLQKIDGGELFFVTMEYKVVNGNISLQPDYPRTSYVLETNIPANGSIIFTTSDTVFRPFCAIDVDDIIQEVDDKQESFTLGDGLDYESINRIISVDTTTIPTIPVNKGGTGATSASGALTNLGLSATATELNYCDGVTSPIQTQINGKQNALTAGNGISISSDTISVNASTIPAIAESKVTGLVSDLADKADKTTVPAAYQPKLTAGEGIQIDSNNVISSTTRPAYDIFTVSIPTGATGDVEVYCNNPAIDVSDDTTQGHNPWQKRENIVKQFARHVFLKNGDVTTAIRADETDFSTDTDGSTTDGDGNTYLGTDETAVYDFMLEIDTIYWTATPRAGYIDWKFSTVKFADDCATAHTYDGNITQHIYHAVFNGWYDGTAKLRSIAVHQYPMSNVVIDTTYNYANANGTKYNIGTLPIRMLMIGLHLFVYRTRNIQSIVCGLNKGSSTTVADCLEVDSGFVSTGGWTQGTTENYTTCCMTLGIMNFFGKCFEFVGETIYNKGVWYFAYDCAKHHQINGRTDPSAPTDYTDWISISSPITGTSNRLIRSICGNNKIPFVFASFSPSASSDYSTYYCDAGSYSDSIEAGTYNKRCVSGGSVHQASGFAGIFSFAVVNRPSATNWYTSARLFAFN